MQYCNMMIGRRMISSIFILNMIMPFPLSLIVLSTMLQVLIFNHQSSSFRTWLCPFPYPRLYYFILIFCSFLLGAGNLSILCSKFIIVCLQVTCANKSLKNINLVQCAKKPWDSSPAADSRSRNWCKWNHAVVSFTQISIF